MVELTYALDESGQLVHVDAVPNGIACRCYCPCCSAPLVAKNNGETKMSHFAHASGASCSGAHESELHLLAKDIIYKEKAVMLPQYGKVYPGGMIHFDTVEQEQRVDLSSLQPDLCGVAVDASSGKESRLWIEIRVTHAIGADKRAAIIRNGISCLEIDLKTFLHQPVTRQELTAFLLNDNTSREWTNNPVLEKRRQQMLTSQRHYAISQNESHTGQAHDYMSVYDHGQKMQREQSDFLSRHHECCIIDKAKCMKCKHHTTRQALFEESRRLHLPAWVREALSSNLQYWTRDNIDTVLIYKSCYQVRYDTYLHLLPTSSPDIYNRPVPASEIRQNEIIIPFFQNTVPAMIATLGMKCRHCVNTFQISPTRSNIACDMPNVVHRHRRK